MQGLCPGEKLIVITKSYKLECYKVECILPIIACISPRHYFNTIHPGMYIVSREIPVVPLATR